MHLITEVGEVVAPLISAHVARVPIDNPPYANGGYVHYTFLDKDQEIKMLVFCQEDKS